MTKSLEEMFEKMGKELKNKFCIHSKVENCNNECSWDHHIKPILDSAYQKAKKEAVECWTICYDDHRETQCGKRIKAIPLEKEKSKRR